LDSPAPLENSHDVGTYTTVTCKEFLQELNDFLDGSMDAKLQSELKEHLTWCHHCHVVCDTTKKTIEIYRNNEVYSLPDELRSRLHSAIISKCKSSKGSTSAD
jgi:hypothetical protein